MLKIIFAVLLLVIPTTAKAALELTIYLMRSNTDVATSTTTYDMVDSFQMETTNTTDFVTAVNKVTGLNLVQSGPTGQQVSLFMRGGDSNHTLVTMNGLPIGDASTTNGLHDFGNNFMGTITAIEMVKNPSGAIVGPNSIGGVVNFITGDVYEHSIQFGIGSNNRKTTQIKTYTNIGGTQINVMADGKMSDGISVAPSGTEDDGYIARSINVNTRTLVGARNNELKTNMMINDNDSDLDNGTSDDLDYTAENKSNIYQIFYKHNNDKGHSNFSYGYAEYDRTYVNGSEIDTYDSHRHNFLASNTFVLGNMDLVPGIEYEHKEAKFDNKGSYNSSVDAWEYNTAYFVNSNMRVKDNAILSVGARHQTLEDYDDYTTYKIGGWYEISDELKLRSNWSNSVRTPTLYEKYGADNFGYSGNPTLDVEKGKTLDIGFNIRGLDMVWYTTDISNAITYSNSTYTNTTGVSERTGVEANYGYNINPEWQHNVGAHWSQAEDANGTQLLRRPKWSFNQSFVKQEMTGKYTTTVTHTYTGEHVDTDSSTWARKDMPGVHVLDLHHSVNFANDTSITASLMNAFDEDYERPDGYNQDGRNWAITFKKKF